MKRKWLVVGVILLFVGVTIAPTIAQDIENSQSTSRGDWLYVGGNGPGNYTRIKDAVENASDGDTVFVYNGVYSIIRDTERVWITKHISLIGENKFNTIINATIGSSDPIIVISADYVNISGFTILGQWSGLKGFHIKGVQNPVVHDIIMQYIYNGLYILDVNSGIFYNNTFLDNYWAILGINCIKCIFHNNTFYNNTVGMVLDGVGENIITYNDFRKNYNGIWLNCEYGENIIEYNNILNNRIGISFYHSTGIIRCNNIMRNIFSVGSISLVEKADAIANKSLLTNREKWDNNYWGLLKALLPKTIVAFVIIYIRIPDTTIALKNNYITMIDCTSILAGVRPIWMVPTIQFDWHPAIKPYDIGG